MARLIYADEFMKNFDKEIESGATDVFDAVENALEETPTIEAELVKRGKWITEGKHPFSPECSVCHKHGVQFAPVNYCPNCGARMDGDENA